MLWSEWIVFVLKTYCRCKGTCLTKNCYCFKRLTKCTVECHSGSTAKCAYRVEDEMLPPDSVGNASLVDMIADKTDTPLDTAADDSVKPFIPDSQDLFPFVLTRYSRNMKKCHGCALAFNSEDRYIIRHQEIFRGKTRHSASHLIPRPYHCRATCIERKTCNFKQSEITSTPLTARMLTKEDLSWLEERGVTLSFVKDCSKSNIWLYLEINYSGGKCIHSCNVVSI